MLGDLCSNDVSRNPIQLCDLLIEPTSLEQMIEDHGYLIWMARETLFCETL